MVMTDPDHQQRDTKADQSPAEMPGQRAADDEEVAAQQREVAARRERLEKTARARDIVDARRMRVELGQGAGPTIEELQSLILSADAEAQISRELGERGETGPHLFRGVDGEQRLTVFGTAHVFDRAEVGDLRRAFEEASPDFVLREGTVDFTIDPALSDEQVLERYGEQVYLERLAHAKGIEVRSWDVPWEETMRDAIAHGHAPDAIVAWMMAQGTKHLLKQGRVPSRETLADILKVVRTPAVVEALRRDTGFEFDPDRLDLDRIGREHLGKSLAELDFDTAEAHASPWQRGPTNDVLRRMNELRDARAITMIAEAKRDGRRSFVLAGGDHVLAWQPALEALYPQHEFETLAEPRAMEIAVPVEIQRSIFRVWSEVVSGRSFEGDLPTSPEQLTTTLRGMVDGELDGHLELLAQRQGKELPPLPELRDGASPEEQLAFVRVLTERIYAVQNENNACFTPRLSRDLNGMDCSMSTWVMQYELAKTDIQFEWGSPVGHAIGIVTLRNGERYYADGQGGFVEHIDTVERALPSGGLVIEIANWQEIQEQRPSFFPRYVFVMPNGDVESTIANVDSMLYKQHLGSITDAQRQELGQENARIVEQLQPYALSVQDALRPFATGERDGDGHEVSPLNRILEAVFPASDAMYQRPEFHADESRMLAR